MFKQNKECPKHGMTGYVGMFCEKCLEEREAERVSSWNAMSVDERLEDLRKRTEKLERRQF